MKSNETSRRSFLTRIVTLTIWSTVPEIGFSQGNEDVSDIESQRLIAVDRWLQQLAGQQRASSSRPLRLRRFSDPVYYLTEPLSWDSGGRLANVGPITVPAGFVTDLASVPRTFWSLVPPADIYSIPAVLHDYLYWEQSTSRQEADNVFLLALRDADVEPTRVSMFGVALRLFGDQAWGANALRKQSGERRVLKRFPTDPMTRWEEFKKDPDVFV